jgi:serine/threonine protein kinase/tetratricopeptide (TPR) repeat protein
MSRLNPDRVMDILAEAMELPGPRRDAFLDSTCVGEPGLRREVEELLACADAASIVFDAAAQQIIQPDPEQIGPYQLLEPIGEGGMATVYKARQHHPVKRLVALKLIKLGMDTRQFVARFEAERQALAMMDHPNVARVYDAGSTENGRPYFVMEYVPGESILKWCDARKLPIRERLELLIAVCEAVEHAHRKGIIHRDLKDSNVLLTEVDGRAMPKVIDFGVAKAISQRLTDRTMFTEQGQLIGTPEYMSPEQAERGLDIDTRSDIYSLGVLLYELIAGVQPIASDVWRRGSYEQVQRIIRENEPPRPSTRLSTLGGADAARIAERRHSALPTLIRDLRSELEWIPLKAMRKDREQRYRSAAELADDLRNYLDGRPLIAGPESTAYKLHKFLRRHKAGVAAIAAIMFFLIGGIIATTWQAVRASRAEARALEERDNAKATLEFLTDDVFAGATPDNMRDARLRQQIVDALIVPAAEGVGEAFKDRPLIEANVRNSMQDILRRIGRADLALPHADTALALRRRMLGEDHPDTISSLNNYAAVLTSLSRSNEAESLFKEALDRSRRVQGDDSPDTISALNNYAEALWLRERVAEAEPLFTEALERRRRVLGEDHPDTMRSLGNLAAVRWSLGRAAEAESLYKQVLEHQRRGLGEDHPNTIQSLSNYAAVLHSLGRTADAEPLFKQALARSRRVLGDDHPHTIERISNYAGLLRALGRFAEAEPYFQEAYERARRVLGEDQPLTIAALRGYARALLGQGRASEAEPIARQAVAKAAANSSLGPKHERTKSFAQTHAECLEALGRHADAAAVRKEFGLSEPTTRAVAQPTQPATLPLQD